jgi:hypothetical protein
MSSALGSVRAHGKMWWCEADTITVAMPDHETNPGPFARFGRQFSRDQSREVLKRDFGGALCRGVDMWWFDLGGGWYDDEQIMHLHGQMRRAADRAIHDDRSSVARVAVVVDEQSYHSMSLRNEWLVPMIIRQMHFELPYMGVAYDVVLFDDLQREDIQQQYQVLCFLNLNWVTPERLALIQSKYQRDDKTLLWWYAPGYLGPEGASLERMAALTGMQLTREADAWPLFSHVVTREHPITRASDPTDWIVSSPDRLDFGTYNRIGPRFYVDDAEAQTLGIDLMTDKPNFAVKQMNGWNSIYVGAPELPASYLRRIMQWSGCHVFCDVNHFVLPCRELITIHSAHTDPQVTIKLPQVSDVSDALNGQVLARGTDTFSLAMARHETRILRYTKT